MAVNALYDYTFPSNDRQELFGDDQLVYVHWDGNPTFCSAACFRAPQAMPFETFVSELVLPWAASDPDFDPAVERTWRLDGDAVDVSGDRAAVGLRELGVGHKSLLQFSTAA